MTPLVIDALTHIATDADDVIGWGPHFLAEELIATMDAPRTIMGAPMRIDKSVVFPALALTVPTSNLTFKDQHAYVLDSLEKYPDRLIGGVVMHARLWNAEVEKQLEDMVCNHNVRMMYIHPSLHKYWLPIQTPSEGEGSKQLLYPLFEAARALKIPVLIHTGEQPYSMPATVDFVAGQFPDVTIIIGHLGTQGEMLTIEALLVAERHPNVYLETSFAMGHMLIESVHTVGHERILFGSNTPPQEPTQQLMMVTESLTYDPPVGMALPAEKTRMVIGGNLAKLLRISEPRI